ncbi:MAG: serine/threonine protein kinase [Deltaproteobacteria bacterium]|nr:serine/threonine protein kinase [Deltaproteobacteria bacterium]
MTGGEQTTKPEMARPSVLDALIGMELAGRFKILERLGSGAMGTVFRAEQTTVGRHVAIKVLKPELALDPRMGVRFQREARAASRIESPNVVTIHDFGESAGMLFIAMEMLDGASLASHIERRGTLPPSEAVAIATDIARALAAGHDAGVVHRDLKPDNVVVTRRGVVKVLDFGIAKLLEDPLSGGQESSLTQMGAIVGTPLYMSPECASRMTVGKAADLYALGVLLYELLTGSPPFVEDVLVILLGMHVQATPPPLVSRHPGLRIPAELDDLVMRLLSKIPEARGTADEVVRELERINSRGLSTWDSLTNASLARDAARAADWWRSQRAAPGSGVQDVPALGPTFPATPKKVGPSARVADDVFESAPTTLASSSSSGARPLPATQELASHERAMPAAEPPTEIAPSPFASSSGQHPLVAARSGAGLSGGYRAPVSASYPLQDERPSMVPRRVARGWIAAVALAAVGVVLIAVAATAAVLLGSRERATTRAPGESAPPAAPAAPPAPPAPVVVAPASPPAAPAPAPSSLVVVAPASPPAAPAPAPSSLPLGLAPPPSDPAPPAPPAALPSPPPAAPDRDPPRRAAAAHQPPRPSAPAAARVPRVPAPRSRSSSSPAPSPPRPAPRACPAGYVCD